MNLTFKHFYNFRIAAMLFGTLLFISPTLTVAQEKYSAPDLDLTIKYFNRELTPEGVVRLSNYEEAMLRRSGHVWSYRILPAAIAANDNVHHNHEHKEFNSILLPRHVKFDGKNLSVEFINKPDRQIINIVPTEYENVNFDGSWMNAFHLVDPKVVAAMPVTRRASTASNARWHEVEKNGIFQRVLWDEKKSIPLAIETGDHKNTFFQRISISLNANLTKELPWANLQGYTQKEYSDFLD